MHSVIDNFILSWSQNSVKLHLTSKELCSEQKNIFQVNPIVIFLFWKNFSTLADIVSP